MAIYVTALHATHICNQRIIEEHLFDCGDIAAY